MMSNPAPGRKFLFLLVVFATALASSACVQVLGDFETRAGGPSGGQKDASVDGSNPSSDGGSASCTAGAKKCEGQELQVCNGSNWQTEATCPFLCMSGACVS